MLSGLAGAAGLVVAPKSEAAVRHIEFVALGPGRALVVLVAADGQVENRVIYDNQNYVFRGEFEFANDPRSFFNEEDPAVQRMGRAFAESVVSTLVNGFGVNDEK